MYSLPGIIEGAAHGKGRGRQVIAVAKSADVILMVLDAAKERGNRHKEILEQELHTVGLRLNRQPPNISLKVKEGGGVKFNSTANLTKVRLKLDIKFLRFSSSHSLSPLMFSLALIRQK